MCMMQLSKKALVYMMLWLKYNYVPVNVVTEVVKLYLVNIFVATNEFLRDNKDLLN